MKTAEAQEAHFEANIGKDFWHNAKKSVANINFQGGNIKYIEGNGSVKRKFTFKGDVQSVTALRDHFKYMQRVIEERQQAEAEITERATSKKGFFFFLRKGI